MGNLNLHPGVYDLILDPPLRHTLIYLFIRLQNTNYAPQTFFLSTLFLSYQLTFVKVSWFFISLNYSFFFLTFHRNVFNVFLIFFYRNAKLFEQTQIQVIIGWRKWFYFILFYLKNISNTLSLIFSLFIVIIFEFLLQFMKSFCLYFLLFFWRACIFYFFKDVLVLFSFWSI